MTGYLDAALRRMALPIRVVAAHSNISGTFGWAMQILGAPSWDLYEIPYRSPAEATAAYLALCRELDPTAS